MGQSFSFASRTYPSHLLRINKRELLVLYEGNELKFLHLTLLCIMTIRLHTSPKCNQFRGSQAINSEGLEDLLEEDDVLSCLNVEESSTHHSETNLCANLEAEEISFSIVSLQLEDLASLYKDPVFLFTSFGRSKRTRYSTKKKKKGRKATKKKKGTIHKLQNNVFPSKRKTRDEQVISHKKSCVREINTDSKVTDLSNNDSSTDYFSPFVGNVSTESKAMDSSNFVQPSVFRRRSST